MTNVINFFSEKVNANLGLNTEATGVPRRVTEDQVQALVDYDFRGEWQRTRKQAPKHGLSIDTLECHSVTLRYVSSAVLIASKLAHDDEAEDYFSELAQEMLDSRQYYIDLGDIPTQFRGYVYSLNFTTIISAGSLADSKVDDLARSFTYFN